MIGFGIVSWPEGKPEMARFCGAGPIGRFFFMRRMEWVAQFAGMRRCSSVRPVAADDNPIVVARRSEKAMRQWRASRGWE
jgi:hypothetical protein